MRKLYFRLITCILLVSVLNHADAQQSIDSLQQIIKRSKNAEILCDTYNDLAFQLSRSLPDSAIAYGKKALELAEKHKFADQIPPAYNAIGLAYQSKGMYQISIDKLKKQLPYIEDDYSTLSRVYHNIGTSYKFMGDLNSALEYESKSAKALEKDPDVVTLGAIYQTIGNIYRNLGDFKLAFEYLNKSLDTYNSGTEFGIYSKNALMAITYSSIGNAFQVQDQLDSAKYYHIKAIKLMEGENDAFNLAILKENLGDDYYRTNELDKAIEQYNQAKDIMVKMNSGPDIGYEYSKIANIYRTAKDYKKAIAYSDSALALFLEFDSDNNRLDLYKLNSVIYDSLGDPAAALKAYKMYIELKDSLNTSAQQSEVLRLKEEFEATQKEQRIALLETTNTLQLRENERQVMFRNIAIGATVMLLLFGFLLWNRYRIKQQVKQLEMRNEIAIDLHDEVGSSLSSIKMLSEIAVTQTGDQKQLNDILSRIQLNAGETAEKMHDIIWMINPKHDQLSGILQRMENFLFDMCSPKDITFEIRKHIDLHAKLNMVQRKNLLLIFKEAVNNAVKYSNATTINAEVRQDGNQIILIIEDNGIGFDVQSIRRGNGLDSMEIRTKELNGTLQLESKPNAGTKILVTFP